MSEIKVIQRPDNISWEELAECQRQAHESNKVGGVLMMCADFSAEELRNAVKDGVTFVALDENDVLAGMLSVQYKEVHRWWHKGKGAYICYVSVSPRYKGQGVYRKLSQKAEERIVADGVNVEYLNTHIGNKSAQRAYEKDGYRKVRFSPGSGSDYYSVEMAKWINGRAKNKKICYLMYCLTELVVRLLYKPGKIRRF